ncbi:MAG: zinc ribbon domain-containing protein, partial [Candidatus Nitrosocaldus sp.]
MEIFFDALSRGIFTIARCRSCSLIIWPPNPVCRRCLSSDIEWVEMNPSMDEIKGKAIAVADSYIRDARFAFIELENGIRLLGRILDDAGVGSQVVMVGCGIDSSSKKPYYI